MRLLTTPGVYATPAEIYAFVHTKLYVLDFRYQWKVCESQKIIRWMLGTMLSLLFHSPLQFHIILACYLLTLGYSSATRSLSKVAQWSGKRWHPETLPVLQHWAGCWLQDGRMRSKWELIWISLCVISALKAFCAEFKQNYLKCDLHERGACLWICVDALYITTPLDICLIFHHKHTGLTH